jgi:hypothetical protein
LVNSRLALPRSPVENYFETSRDFERARNHGSPPGKRQPTIGDCFQNGPGKRRNHHSRPQAVETNRRATDWLKTFRLRNPTWTPSRDGIERFGLRPLRALIGPVGLWRPPRMRSMGRQNWQSVSAACPTSPPDRPDARPSKAPPPRPPSSKNREQRSKPTRARDRLQRSPPRKIAAREKTSAATAGPLVRIPGRGCDPGHRPRTR